MSEIRKAERRQYPRIQVNWPATISTPQGDIEGWVENLSPDGAFLVSCQEPVPLEGTFRLAIKPPERQALRVTAEVIWTSVFIPEKGEPCLELGVRFIYVSEEDQKFLHALISDLENR
jgi:hypothetical protein